MTHCVWVDRSSRVLSDLRKKVFFLRPVGCHTSTGSFFYFKNILLLMKRVMIIKVFFSMSEVVLIHIIFLIYSHSPKI